MKRSVQDIIIKGMKYIILILLLVMVILFVKGKIKILTLININIISSIYIIIYKIIYKKEILESEKTIIDKYIFILFIVIAIIFLILNWNYLGILYFYTLINIYLTGIDFFRRIIRKTQIVNIIEQFVELITMFRNNIKVQKIENTEKNILILISRLNTGGAERVAVNLANNFKNKYDNVLVLTYNEKTENDYKCIADHIQIENRKIKRIKEIQNIKKKYNITHSISFCTTANYLNVSSNNGEKIIISIRNYLSNSKEKGMKKLQAKISAKYADKIVAVTKTVAIDQIENYKANKEKVITINNFYEGTIIDEKTKQKIESIKEQEFFNKHDVIITIGRLSYQKGQWYLIRAFKEVIKECPNARLVILGKGDYKQKLKNLITKLQLEKYVKLYGFKENPYQYLSRAKVFVLESLYEGMSNVILEAMKCGLPIIATDCLAGNREILAPKTDVMKHTDKMELAEYGIIVPVGDGKYYELEDLNSWEIELKNAMVKMLKNKDIREKYIKQSQIRIKDFKRENIIEQWYNLIEGE